MGCIRVDKITEYLCEPLRKCLKDEDPYVRKTAAVCVAKLHDINAQLVEDQGFLDSLKELLSDANPMVRICYTSNLLSTFTSLRHYCLVSSDFTMVTIFKINEFMCNKLQVVANAVAALSEINDASPTAAASMEMNSQTINKLLTALNECTE